MPPPTALGYKKKFDLNFFLNFQDERFFVEEGEDREKKLRNPEQKNDLKDIRRLFLTLPHVELKLNGTVGMIFIQ